MFLGSILTFLVVSMLTKGSSLEYLVFARQIISTGVSSLTLPGMWLIVITGVFMTIRSYGFLKHRWLNLKHLLILVIVLNAHFVIVPAAGDALEIAKLSLAQGKLLPEYDSAYMRESIFGAINVLLIIISMIAGIWRFRKKVISNTEQTSAIG